MRVFSALMFVWAVTACGSSRVQLPIDAYVFVVNKAEFKVCSKSECSSSASAITGSGFITHATDSGSWGITAGHLCSWPQSVKLPNGTETVNHSISLAMFGGNSYPAEVAIIEPAVDVCIVHIPGVRLPTVRLSKSPPELGDRVYTLSSPLGVFEPTMVPKFSGYFSGAASLPPKTVLGESTIPFFAYTIPARPGSSGAPIFNSSGEVIGMTSIALTQFENFALSPPHSVMVIVFNAVSKLSKGK